MDNWQWNGRLADSWFLNAFSLNPFNLAVSIAYCLLWFQIALTPSALIPSAWQFPNAIGALPQTLPPFLSWHKKGAKKSQDCARFARKIVVRKAQIVQLVEVRWSYCTFEKAWHELQLRTGTIFNRLPHLFFGSPAEVEGQEVIGNDPWIDFFLTSSA